MVSGSPEESIWAGGDGSSTGTGMWRGEGLGMEAVRGKRANGGKGKGKGEAFAGASSQADALWGDREGEVGRLADYLRTSNMTETAIDGAG